MDLSEAILLAIIQGITEWLPISSSGHLALIQNILGIDAPIAFDILLHIGTLLAVFIYFWKELLEIAKAIFFLKWNSEEFKLAVFIGVASIPTAVIGLVFRKFFETIFHNILYLGIAFLITGVILYLTKNVKKNDQKLDNKKALLIGIAQGIAVAPGISRSGSTIGAGLLLGLNRRKAATFSFLMSIPAIIGAFMLDARSVILDIDPVNGFVGILISGVVGYLTIKYLMKIIEDKKFYLFAYYCWLVGALSIIYALSFL
ncbi:undecaprenyl-diphosphate phosphatase [Candidatus Micrarchaeota archaeon]|nr:undecaprenyl-diphosphate phosphatase [Candidatus Micrarchaeota archaeon]